MTSLNLTFALHNGSSTVNKLMNESTTKELITEYCSAVNSRLIWPLGFILLMWLLEPRVKRYVESLKIEDPTIKNILNPETLMFLYKFIGLGLIFLAGYGLWILA